MTRAEISTYLNDGTPVSLRPLERSDKDRLREGIARLSDRTRYLRFFTEAQHIPEHILNRLVDVDGYRHIAWGAIDMAGLGGNAVGAAHAIRNGHAAEAELAFAVIDSHQGRGLARMLVCAVLLECRSVGVQRLTAEVLSENAGAKAFLRSLGGFAHDCMGSTTSYVLTTDHALHQLNNRTALPGVQALLDADHAAARRVA